MRQKTNTTEELNTADLFMTLAEVQEKMRAIFLAKTHWGFVVDEDARIVLEAIRFNYFTVCRPDVFVYGEIYTLEGRFGILFAGKNRMTAPQLSRLLSRMNAGAWTPVEIEERDFMIIASGQNLSEATWIAQTLVADANATDRTATEDDIPTSDAGSLRDLAMKPLIRRRRDAEKDARID